MAGYSFGKGPRGTYYDYFIYDTSSSTADDTTSIEARRQNRIRVENQMRYEWIPKEKEIKIERPIKAFMEYTNDLGLDKEFYEKLKSEVLKMRKDKFALTGKVEEEPEKEVEGHHELMFDPQNLDM